MEEKAERCPTLSAESEVLGVSSAARSHQVDRSFSPRQGQEIGL